jgi:hypothetical protein
MRETEKSSIAAWCPLKGLMPASGVKAGKWEYCLAQETEIGSWIEGGVGIVLQRIKGCDQGLFVQVIW